MKSIYLDYAAATPMHAIVLAAMKPYFTDDFYNPSAPYLAARAVGKALDEARASVAGHLGAKPAEIFFTAGATEANNLAISGIMRKYPAGEVLVSAIEHESVLAPANEFKRRLIPVDRQGMVDTKKLLNMINDKTVLVSVMLVNNELGSLQPVKEISQIINKISALRKRSGNKLPLYLHTDAAQAPLYLDLHVSRLGVDLLSINGGKIYGPKQSGVLFIKAGIQPAPIITGGGQERGLRSGTENVPAIVGLAKALELAQKNKNRESAALNTLRNLFISRLEKELPAAIVNGSPKHHAPHILSVSFPGIDNERLMIQLDEAGVQAAVGSACSASNDEPSHVLTAIGLSEEQARSTLRFSFGKNTDEQAIARTIKLLADFTAV